jgi:cellulase/cellobiase CelA1
MESKMKTHLRINKLTGINAPIAVCSGFAKNGKIRLNNRNTYADMTSPIVGLTEFVATEEKQRCVHCVTEGLNWRNRQRKAKGFPPISWIGDKWSAA